ncbi:unnamed protein product [Hermetia illucens]|uniref:Uncharacterized protein n=1 Tax=Hermetia illucens TaxID=343691 RepID=A0A7R8YQ01_HERIL|nr:unnamed protein product [Hermetia illucens]
MFWLIRFALLIAVFAQLKLCLGRRDFSVVFDACEVLETTKFCDMNCSISDSKRVTYYWNILERASKYGFGIKMFGKTSGLKEHVKIFEHSVDDICPLLSKSKSGNMFLLILDEVKRYAKLPKCPVEKCGPNDPCRDEKLNMIRRLMSSMENIQGSVSIAGVRDQVKMNTEGKSKDISIDQKDNAGIVHISPPNNQLTARESKVPSDKKRMHNYVHNPIKMGDDNIEEQQEKSSPKHSAKLDDVGVVHISSKSF